MRVSTLSSDYSYSPTGNGKPKYANRSVLRSYIVIHKFMAIGSLILLPLLTWHNAMTHLVDKYDMPSTWEEDFREVQLSGPNTSVWVFMWILTPIDFLHALLCLGWYHELLHPRSAEGEDVAKENERRQHKPSNRKAHRVKQQRPTDDSRTDASATAHSDRFSKLASIFHNVQRRVLRFKNSFTPPNPTTPHTYHPLLHSALPPSAHLVLLTLYDTFLILLLTFHNYTYLITIAPSMAFCYTEAVRNFPTSAFPSIEKTTAEKDVVFPPLSMMERCERLNWNIHVAGGFASAIAAILAVMHLAAIVCRPWECCLAIIEQRQRKRKTSEEVELQHIGTNWDHPPRDIDIHFRAASSQKKGRLTKISEEEHHVGDEVTRRRQATRSKSSESEMSKSSSAASGKLEGLLLECLVP